MPALLLGSAAVAGLTAGPWLARTTVRLARDDDAARATPLRAALTAVVLASLLAGAAAVTGPRPALVALTWAAGAGLVLAGVDLARHRLPDRVTYPAGGVCLVALIADAATEGSWPALVRALAAAAACAAVAGAGWLLIPAGTGLGDVKLLALLGLVLGWLGWGVLLAGIFLGLLVGSLVSVLLVASRRAGWRTALPFGPPLLAGAVLAVALQATGSLG